MQNLTEVKRGKEARKIILEGINLVYATLVPTLGPEGKSALLPRSYNRGPRSTNDGVTISENIMPRDEFVRLVVESFKEAAKKVNEIVGDGTTTVTVISGFLINKTFNLLSEQFKLSASLKGKKKEEKGVRALKKEMNEAKVLVLEAIKERAKPIKTLADLEKIAVVSIGKEYEKVSKEVAKMVWELGRDSNGDFIDNYIDVVEGYKGDVETELIRGMRYPAKVAHRAFLTNPERFEMVGEDVQILITNYKLDNPVEVQKMLNVLQVPKIALFAPDFSSQTIQMLANTSKGGMFCYPVKCPALRTEQLEDIAVYTGANLIDKDTGKKLDNVTKLDLGFAEKIAVKDTENKEDALLLGGRGAKVRRGEGNLISKRQDILKKQMKESRNEMTTMSLERRIANLSAAVGVIRVGSSTSNEGLYLKLKVEDGVFACKAALQEGYVEGGGLCLKKIAEKLPENILTDALKHPYEVIQQNAGGSLDIGKDIIDPTKVVRLEVEFGVSIAAQMITNDIIIPDMTEKSPAEGYEAIADSILRFVRLEEKKSGLFKENADFQDEQTEKWQQDALLGDKG